MIFEPMAAKKTSAKKLTKSSFIRSQPPEMSAAEIVAKGKVAGMKISDSLVYMVRGPKDGKGSPKRMGAAKKSTSNNASRKESSTAIAKSPSPRTGGQSKAEFVRANPGVTVKDLVAKALFEGIEISENYVYGVRAQDRKGTKLKAATSKKSVAKTVSKRPTTASTKTAAAKPASSNGTRASGSASSVEDLLRAVAAEIGLGRAMEILTGERARVRAVMGG